jgi:flagellar hook-basal body complex protein FliE
LLFQVQATTFSLFSVLSLSLSQEPFPNDATAHHEFLKSKSAELSLEEFIAALKEMIRQVKEEKENTTADSRDFIADSKSMYQCVYCSHTIHMHIPSF